jgi:hypothetical protein
MSRGEAQFAPGELTQTVQGVSKCRLLALLAGGQAIRSAVKIAEGKEWGLLIRWLVGLVSNPEAWPLRGWRASETTRAHT